MNNEIKEIKDNFKNKLDIEMEEEEITFTLTIEECTKIFDYITNLQEELTLLKADRERLLNIIDEMDAI